MIIYPAIDLIDGRAVRLDRGDYDKKTEYSNDPTEVARQFAKAGAEYIHIIDLDGAKEKRPMNLLSVEEISKSVDLPIQVGGGIRSEESAAQLLQYAERVILGTVALTEPELLKKLLRRFGPKRIVVSVDYKKGKPAMNGWLESFSADTKTLQKDLHGAGVKLVIITDTERDGLMQGPNIELTKKWLRTDFEIICAGGVSSVDDIENLKNAGAAGAVIGKALYEKRIKLEEAVDAGK